MTSTLPSAGIDAPSGRSERFHVQVQVGKGGAAVRLAGDDALYGHLAHVVVEGDVVGVDVRLREEQTSSSKQQADEGAGSAAGEFDGRPSQCAG